VSELTAPVTSDFLHNVSDREKAPTGEGQGFFASLLVGSV